MTNPLEQEPGSAAGWEPRGIDTQTPSTARMYDYYLGGKNHYPADREAADQILAVFPGLATAARENRKFLQRAVRVMAEDGIGQFLDLGTGLPTQENVHQVAQAINPAARVAYVDNDPVTLVHARALLANNTQTTVADADLRDPDQVLSNPRVRDLVDFDEPVGVLLVAMLHFVTDDEDPAGIVAAFRDAVPSGSYLALTHGTPENASVDAADQGTHVYEQATSTLNLRTPEQVRGFFAGFEVLGPGVLPVDQWRPDPADADTAPTPLFGGLGRKP